MQSFAYFPLKNAQPAALDEVTLAAVLNSVADLVVSEVVDPATAKRRVIGPGVG
jgi:hypothetical protein